MNKVVLILNNLRSVHNVGSLMRTADGLGVHNVYLCGYTPYPTTKNDKRLPHISSKIDKQINKTALGAEKTVAWEHVKDVKQLINKLKRNKYKIYAIEQHPKSIDIRSFHPQGSCALILGREVEGIEDDVVSLCDEILEIPMLGKKESYNVAVAGAIALYQSRPNKL